LKGSGLRRPRERNKVGGEGQSSPTTTENEGTRVKPEADKDRLGRRRDKSQAGHHPLSLFLLPELVLKRVVVLSLSVKGARYNDVEEGGRRGREREVSLKKALWSFVEKKEFVALSGRDKDEKNK